MKYKISCSFGEVIDKITILNIKLSKTNDINKINNLQNELNCIINDCNIKNMNDKLFYELYRINLNLWELEDAIRIKSKLKKYDNEYITISENIHTMNDKRFLVKRKINENYCSELIEEKIYNLKEDYEEKKLNYAKYLFNTGEFNKALECIEPLIQKYKDTELNTQKLIDLFISYNNILSIYGESKYFEKIEKVYYNVKNLDLIKEFIDFFYNSYCILCLSKNEYEKIKDIKSYHDCLTGPNINKHNSSFFSNTSKNETLLIHENGGLGDYIMYSRFIPELCDKYNNNSIVFLVNDKLEWIIKDVFKKIKNLLVIPHSKRDSLPFFDHHCSLFSLFFNLGYIKYELITFTPYLKNINCKYYNKYDNFFKIIESIDKPIYLFNWHGNFSNSFEKFNRGMDIKDAINFFKKYNICAVTPTLDINNNEEELLNKNNILILKNIIPNFDEVCFEDTINILKYKKIKGLISTDTSLVHLSLSLNIKTFVLLTKGCDWRWTKYNDKTNWYPNAILLRQNEINNWDNLNKEVTF